MSHAPGNVVSFEGGPYDSETSLVIPNVILEFELQWKDTGEVAGVYRWNETRRVYEWRQVSNRPANPLMRPAGSQEQS